jgi:hypothetical protein
MKELGFEEGRSFNESTWIHDYLPAFEASLHGKEKRLWETPGKYSVNGINIGQILSDIRCGRTLPEIHIPLMEAMGFYQERSYVECRFEFVYMPALRDCIFGREKRLSETKQKHVHNEVPVGKLISCMRMGDTLVPPLYKDELATLGLGHVNTKKRKRKEKNNDDDSGLKLRKM